MKVVASRRVGCGVARVSRGGFAGGVAAATLFAIAGCAGREPRAGISDPAVFTALHLRAAQTSLAAQSTQSGNTIGDMDRYLRTPESDYQSKRLRMDAMLDSNQRSRAVAQAVLSRLSVDIELLAKSIETADGGTGKDDGEAKPEGEKPDDETGSKEAASKDDASDKPDRVAELNEAIRELGTKIDELAKLATTTASDSPFDTVDRAQDFYTTVLHKSLRNFGVDSHVVPAAETYAVLEASEKLATARATFAVAEARLNAAIERDKAKGSPERVGAMAELQAAYKRTTDSDMPKATSGSDATPKAGATVGATPAPVAGQTAQAPAQSVVVNATPASGGTGGSGGLPVGTVGVMGDITARGSEAPKKDPNQVEINQSARDAENARKEAEVARDSAEKARDAAEKSRKLSEEARKAAAEAEAKTAAELTKKAEAELKLKELALRTDAQDHAQQLEWFARVGEASEEVDRKPGESAEVCDARDALARAAAEVTRATDEFNAVVSAQRGNLNDGVSDRFSASGTVLQDGRRLVVLLLQAHIDRGLAPNHMVGLRARITGAMAGSDRVNASEIRVVRLHPTRNYDREDALFAEQLSEQILLSAAGRFGESANGAAARQLATESAEKQRYLSRIPKVASWADASKREFGWDFYPNNLNVKRRGPLARSAGLIYGPAARNFEIIAHLDPGARDCAVYAIVPCNVTSVTLDVETITADLSSPWSTARDVVGDRGTVTVPLPPFNPAEWKAGVGVLASDATGGYAIESKRNPHGATQRGE